MKLPELTADEADLFMRMRADIWPAHLKSYPDYLGGPGYGHRDIKDIPLSQSMHRKRYLTFPLDYAHTTGTHLWFSKAAWDLFGLDEWTDIEQERLEKERPEDWGQWG